MNYLKARQRKNDNRWDFTSERKGTIFPIGYCRNYFDIREYNHTSSELQKHEDNKEKYHNGGHETKEDACECYKNYLLDNKTHLNIVQENVQRRCQICTEYTNLMATVDGHIYDLCEKHNTIAVLEKLFKTPDEIWRS